jgi:hypothetical protein
MSLHVFWNDYQTITKIINKATSAENRERNNDGHVIHVKVRFLTKNRMVYVRQLTNFFAMFPKLSSARDTGKEKVREPKSFR